MRLISRILLLAIGLGTAFAHGDQSDKALVIVDMQPGFLERDGVQNYGDNPKIYAKLIEKQKEMIDIAKKNHVPIMVVEYGDLQHNGKFYPYKGPTDSKLLQHIGEYDKMITVFKNTDGLMDPKNISQKAAHDKLKEWGTKELIVMGVHGNACVQDTITYAMRDKKYKVWAYKEGIAVLGVTQNTWTREEKKDFIYPYSFYERRPSGLGEWEARGFKEFSDPNEPFKTGTASVQPLTETEIHSAASQ